MNTSVCDPDASKALWNAKTSPENFPLPPMEPQISPLKKHWHVSLATENGIPPK